MGLGTRDCGTESFLSAQWHSKFRLVSTDFFDHHLIVIKFCPHKPGNGGSYQYSEILCSSAPLVFSTAFQDGISFNLLVAVFLWNSRSQTGSNQCN